MELTQEMQALINSHLPQMAANQMAEFIAQAKQDADDLKKTQANLENAEHHLKEYRARHSMIEEVSRANGKRTTELDARDKKLYADEMALDLAKNKLVADVATAELKGVKDTTSLFLRNVTVRTNVTESVGIPVAGNPGGNGYQGSPGYVADKTQSRFESKEQE